MSEDLLKRLASLGGWDALYPNHAPTEQAILAVIENRLEFYALMMCQMDGRPMGFVGQHVARAMEEVIYEHPEASNAVIAATALAMAKEIVRDEYYYSDIPAYRDPPLTVVEMVVELLRLRVKIEGGA